MHMQATDRPRRTTAARRRREARGARSILVHLDWGFGSTLSRRQQIKQFILGNFLFTDDDSAFADDTSLIQQGIVDSTGILELIGFIEETWPINVPPEDMTPAHFDSLSAIDRYLDGRLAA